MESYLSMDVLSLILLIWVTIAVVFIAYLYKLLTTKYEYFIKQGVNGPDPTIPTGSWRNAWKSIIGEEDLDRISRYGKVHGTFDGALPNLIVTEPALIKKVLHDDANHFRSRRAYRVKNATLRNSLLSIEGYDNKDLKNLLASTLSTDKIKKLIPRVNQSINSMVRDVNKEIKEDKEVLINVSQKTREYLSDMLAFTIFGVEFTTDNKLKEQFLKIVEGAYFIRNPNTGFAVTPFLFDILSSLDDFILNKSSLHFLTNLCHSTIQARRKQDVNTSVGKAVNFLDLLITAAEEEKKKQSAKEKEDTETNSSEIILNDNQIVTQIVSMVLCIIQVARSSLMLSLHTLAKLPAVQNKLHQEITKELQTQHDFTYDLVQNCEYLDQFLAEIFRLYPLEYRLERECAEDITLGEIKVEPGVLISVPVYAIHRHKDFYPEPETFEPDRFSSENMAKRDHYTYLPFGQAGTNSTNVGIQLGVLVTKLALAVLINDFKWLSGEDSKVPIDFISGITGVPRPPEIFVKAEIN